MEFSCHRPCAFFALLLILPVVALSVVRYRKIVSRADFFSAGGLRSDGAEKRTAFSRRIVLRIVFSCLAWTALVFSAAGFSWGTYLEPVRKSGGAVSFVFDISYSMNAGDAGGGMSRLEAAGRYAEMMLSHIGPASVSVTLAKGDGVTAVPLTEDAAAVESLIASLSPNLMTSAGTSLGGGITAALRSFPKNSARANRIWVFTDGDETDGKLESALTECALRGVPVSLVGFGSERETPVLTGDGRTTAMTALRAEGLRNTVAAALKKAEARGVPDARIQYVDSEETGSALRLLEQLRNAGDGEYAGADGDTVSYEVRPRERYRLFLALAVIFFALGVAAAEFSPERARERLRRYSRASVVLILPLLLSSCGARVSGASAVLQGAWAWRRHRYDAAVADFLQTAYDAEQSGDSLLAQYAVYNLAASYQAQDESDAALERLKRIGPDADSAVRHAAFYNMGVIAYSRGEYETAARLFRSALKISGPDLNAKINLELSLAMLEPEARARENAAAAVSERDDSADILQDAVFERIRENDQKQWKNSETAQASGSSADY